MIGRCRPWSARPDIYARQSVNQRPAIPADFNERSRSKLREIKLKRLNKAMGWTNHHPSEKSGAATG